jgi:hypothetical protein
MRNQLIEDFNDGLESEDETTVDIVENTNGVEECQHSYKFVGQSGYKSDWYKCTKCGKDMYHRFYNN